MSKDRPKSYRTDGSPVPGTDYKCTGCPKVGVRLWRQAHIFLNYVELLCAECAAVNQQVQIAKYARFHDEHSCTIGDLVPARPTQGGDTFWGHTSGDLAWWYALPQHEDPSKELLQVRRERDRHVDLYQSSLTIELDLRRRLAEALRGEGSP